LIGIIDQTREVKLHELKTKLLSIISKITESTKLNKTPVVEPRRNVLKRVGESSLEIMFELVNFLKFSAKGIGKPGVRKAFNFALIFFIGLAVLYVIKLIAQKQEPPAADHKIITETLIKDYNNKLEFYNQKSGSLKRKIQKELSGNPKRQLEAETELITVKRKIDSLNAVILPDLELIKNKPIDPSRRSRLNAYIQILKNF
jgi:hypothetical protein